MLLTVDDHGIMLTVNSTTAIELGYAAEELLGQPVTSIVHADDQAQVQQHFADCLGRPGEVFRWEFRKVRKDGTLLWVREPPGPYATRTRHSRS